MKEVIYDWGGLNVWLFHAVNDVHGDLLDRFMLLGTNLGSHNNFPLYLLLLVLAGVVVSARSHRQERTLQWLTVVAVFAGAYVLDGLLLGWLKPTLDFARPVAALPLGSVHVVGPPELRHSLPSGHASFAMLVAASLWPVAGRYIRIAAVAFVLWVGLSRISVGAHFPADVLAGYLSCLAVVLVTRVIVTGLARKAAR